MSNPETVIQNRCLLEIGCDPGVMAWRQQVGAYRMLNRDVVVKVGDKGASDALLVVAVKITPEMVGQTIGAAVGAEFKTATGRQSPDQKLWQENLERRGGIYRLVRSPEEMRQLVDDVKSGVAWLTARK